MVKTLEKFFVRLYMAIKVARSNNYPSVKKCTPTMFYK